MCISGLGMGWGEKMSSWILYREHYPHSLSSTETWQNQHWKCTWIKLAAKTKALTIPCNPHVPRTRTASGGANGKVSVARPPECLYVCVPGTLWLGRAHVSTHDQTKQKQGGGWPVEHLYRKKGGEECRKSIHQRSRILLYGACQPGFPGSLSESTQERGLCFPKELSRKSFPPVCRGIKSVWLPPFAKSSRCCL